MWKMWKCENELREFQKVKDRLPVREVEGGRFDRERRFAAMSMETLKGPRIAGESWRIRSRSEISCAQPGRKINFLQPLSE